MQIFSENPNVSTKTRVTNSEIVKASIVLKLFLSFIILCYPVGIAIKSALNHSFFP